MKRRTFLQMLGLAPVVGVAVAAVRPAKAEPVIELDVSRAFEDVSKDDQAGVFVEHGPLTWAFDTDDEREAFTSVLVAGDVGRLALVRQTGELWIATSRGFQRVHP